MEKLWTEIAWENYLHWQNQDKKTLKRINQLIKDIERNGYEGIGKPEPLKNDLSGWWSRRIDDTNRLIYRIENEKLILCSTAARPPQIGDEKIIPAVPHSHGAK